MKLKSSFCSTDERTTFSVTLLTTNLVAFLSLDLQCRQDPQVADSDDIPFAANGQFLMVLR